MNLDPGKTAFVFPGQGSQSLGMGRELAAENAAAARVFTHADATLGLPLSQIMWEGPEAALNDTINTQPALFVHSMAAFQAFREAFPEFRPALLAGHSLGELSALCAGGALDERRALLLVRRRGELMKQAGEQNPGGMAAILNLDIPALEDICQKASMDGEAVQVANDNCPGQVVISGAKAAVDRAIELAKAAGARRAMPLAVSIAAHSALMDSIQGDWNAAVDGAGIGNSEVDVIGNVGARGIREAADLRTDIQQQMQSRVRWTETIQEATRRGIDTFVEVGSGTVLLGLIRRIAPAARGLPLGSPADLAALSSL